MTFVYLVSAINVPPEIATVGDGVEIESGGTGEGVGHHAKAGSLQAPVILLAALAVGEETL